MIFEHDIFTFEVTRDRNNLTIMMIDYTTENGETVLLILIYVLGNVVIEMFQEKMECVNFVN